MRHVAAGRHMEVVEALGSADGCGARRQKEVVIGDSHRERGAEVLRLCRLSLRLCS